MNPRKKLIPSLLFLLALSCLACIAHAQQNKRPEASLLRGPYLQVTTTNSIVIRWRTDVLVRGIVRYGTTPGLLNKTAQDTLLVSEHKIKLEGLEPATRYYYSIGSWKDTLQGGPDSYFVTLPVAGTEGFYRIAAVGDCGNNSVNQRNVRDQLVRYLGDKPLDSWILLGDNAYGTGRDAEFQSNFFNIYKGNLLKYPLFPTPGNHDYYDGDAQRDKVQKNHEVAYYQNFSMPIHGEAGGVASLNPAYYSFDLGNIHFLSLDSYGIEEDQFRMSDTTGPQVQWIKKDLEANQNKGWIIAYWHHPPYSMGSHNSDTDDELTAIRQNFIRILERYGVDLILCGHSHDYERSKLIKGHYGVQTSFNPAVNLVSSSSGFFDGTANSCPYIKDSEKDGQGTVYVVSGSAGQLGGKQATYPHIALPYSNVTYGGASMLEIQGNRLDLKWICSDGEIRDHFTMMKNVNQRHTLTVKKGDSLTLTASFNGEYLWTTGNSGKKRLDGANGKSITVTPASNTTYTVKDKLNCIKDIFEVKVVR